jgi:hypothetical protein
MDREPMNQSLIGSGATSPIQNAEPRNTRSETVAWQHKHIGTHQRSDRSQPNSFNSFRMAHSADFLEALLFESSEA